jgi:hypothetical protein
MGNDRRTVELRKFLNVHWGEGIGFLRKLFGKGRRLKRKGFADVRLPNGTIRKAELHWYEASGIGKKEFKIKGFLD